MLVRCCCFTFLSPGVFFVFQLCLGCCFWTLNFILVYWLVLVLLCLLVRIAGVVSLFLDSTAWIGCSGKMTCQFGKCLYTLKKAHKHTLGMILERQRARGSPQFETHNVW